MTNSKRQGQDLSEHIFEIRYRNIPQMIDNRGRLAQLVQSVMDFGRANIGKDRIDVTSGTGDERCFVTVGNAGYVVANPTTVERFYQTAAKFFSGFAKEGYVADSLQVGRIGVRSRFCTQFAGSFDDILAETTRRYVSLNPEAAAAVGGKLVDVGAALNFRDEHGHFNTMCGPMKAAQIRENFPSKDQFPDIPDVGLYYDIDYWDAPAGKCGVKEILSKLEVFAKEGWSRHKRVNDLILGG